MTCARKLQVAVAFALGLILPSAVTVWFFRATVVDVPCIIGKDAPRFNVTSISGDTYSIETCTGKRTVLIFVDLDCPACLRELVSLDKLNRELTGSDLQILAVSGSSRERTLSFARDCTLSFPLAMDSGSMARDYVVRAEPTIIFLDEGNVVRFQRDGSVPIVVMRRLISEFALEGKIALEGFVDAEIGE